ncbi:hypothetical protein [Pseudomonas sp. Pseusp97]|uniref:hypothetical protein n=1 Tax=Pseudomonas sp. Pseusp97 TaxID=3243065 RepID=UPI0039A53899
MQITTLKQRSVSGLKKYGPSVMTFGALMAAAASASAADAVDYTGFTWDTTGVITGILSLGKTMLAAVGAYVGVKWLISLVRGR